MYNTSLLKLLLISLIQGIYNYIHETNRALQLHSLHSSAATIPTHVMLFPMLNVVHFDISTFSSMCAVHNMAVCCCSLTSPLPNMLLRFCLSDFALVPVAPIITGITFVFFFQVPSALFFCCKVFIFFLEFSVIFLD